jgi:hypothetical protein
MSNCKYRIKIEERNNGEKWYIPQVSFKRNWLGKQVWLNIGWLEINDKYTYFSTEHSKQMSVREEERASKIIESYKLYLAEKHSKQTKSITYKEIE